MFLKGIATILICTLLAACGSWLINTYTAFYSPNWWFSLLVFSGLFFTLNIVYNIKTDLHSYSQLLLATISVKLFILLIIIFLYFLYDKTGLMKFFVHFSAHYILFTVFEIRYLLQIIKRPIQPQS